MSTHPANLALRFILELIALVASGMWAWKQSEGKLRYFLVLALPLLLAVIWGTFAVENDPSRSGNTIVSTPGLIRLFIELGIFTFAVWSLYSIDYKTISIVLASVVVLHYLLSYDRIIWLLSQ